MARELRRVRGRTVGQPDGIHAMPRQIVQGHIHTRPVDGPVRGGVEILTGPVDAKGQKAGRARIYCRSTRRRVALGTRLQVARLTASDQEQDCTDKRLSQPDGHDGTACFHDSPMHLVRVVCQESSVRYRLDVELTYLVRMDRFSPRSSFLDCAQVRSRGALVTRRCPIAVNGMGEHDVPLSESGVCRYQSGLGCVPAAGQSQKQDLVQL